MAGNIGNAIGKALNTISEALLSLILFALWAAMAAFVLLVAYGITVLIFRYAFGIELPNPFDWLGADGGRQVIEVTPEEMEKFR